MQVSEAIQHRRSIHHFDPTPVPSTQLREMLALATQAPNAGNRQMWRFIIVTEEPFRQMLAHLVTRKIDEMVNWPEFLGQEKRLQMLREYALIFQHAPAVIFIINQGYHLGIEQMLTEHGMKAHEVEMLFSRPDIQSIGGLIGYLTLIAEERGYGTCWSTDALIARPDLQAALALPAGEELVAVLAIGTPAEYPPVKARKPIDELIQWR